MYDISILMPVFNASKYLHDTLDSILAQTLQNWELIAVDDFSTDDSREILEDYAYLDERITILANTTKGIIPALRLAYNRSQGQFISRMDADDIMASAKLERLHSMNLENPDAIATSHVAYFSDTNLQEGYKKYASWLNTLCDQKSHYRAIYKECVIPSPNWMMHRNTIELIGGIVTNVYPEDYDLCFRCYEHNIPVVSSPEVLHHWRDHPTRASRTDDNYQDNSFLDIKLKYFLKCDYQLQNVLILVGAGRKGKSIAKKLLALDVNFRWMTNNPNKWGHNIYGIEVQKIEFSSSLGQYIIALSSPEDQKDIRSQLAFHDIVQYYFFF